MVRLSSRFPFVRIKISQSYNPGIAVTMPVWAISISLATTLEIDVSFSSSCYLDVSVHRVCSPRGVTGLLPAGLPHSDIFGSILVCKSPKLFAAYHVLLRLQEPRHPPYALAYFLFRVALSGSLPIDSTTPFLILKSVKELFRPEADRQYCGFAPLPSCVWTQTDTVIKSL